jgi:hypothetical protein
MATAKQKLPPLPDARNWRTLERHPLSAEYPDLSGPAATRLREGLAAHGIIGGRCVIMHEGRVLDGWQMLQGCIAADVRPQFAHLPKGMAPEQYVELANDCRRHEPPGVMMARIARRQERVAKAREEGKSIREIASKEGVGRATVVEDLKKTSTVRGKPVVPASGKVMGRDNRLQPATRSPGGNGKATRNGHVAKKVYDWRLHRVNLAAVKGDVDRLGLLYGAKQSKEAEELRRQLDVWEEHFTSWGRKLAEAERVARKPAAKKKPTRKS